VEGDARAAPDLLGTYVCTAAVLDGLGMVAAGLLTFRVGAEGHGPDGTVRLAIALAVSALWILVVRLCGGYDGRFIGDGTNEYRRVLNAGISLTAGVAVVILVAQPGLSYGCVPSAPIAAAVFGLAARFVLRRALYRERESGRCMISVLAVGRESAVGDLVAAFRREPRHGLKVVAACIVGGSTATEVGGVPAAGDLDDVASVTRDLNAVMVAVLSCSEIDGVKLRTLAGELEKTGAGLCVVPALADVTGAGRWPTAGLALLHVDHPKLSGARQAGKDLFDRSAAACALVAIAPVMLGIAAAIRLYDRGPALFVQTRVGKGGRPFKTYKFRTMVVNADSLLREIADKNDSDGVLFKIRKDSRITPVGAKLRKWSIDELPQLFNVLKGEMSLVGPRPALP
jgi:Bacterial sugar transferase